MDLLKNVVLLGHQMGRPREILIDLDGEIPHIQESMMKQTHLDIGTIGQRLECARQVKGFRLQQGGYAYFV